MIIPWVAEVLAAYTVWHHHPSARGPVWECDISVQRCGGTIQCSGDSEDFQKCQKWSGSSEVNLELRIVQREGSVEVK